MLFTLEHIQNQFQAISKTMEDNKQYLIELDSAMGDGDLGLTMTTGFKAAVDSLKEGDPQDIGKSLMQAGMAMNNAASSTMGTLISSAILRSARVAKGKSELDTLTYAEMFRAGVEGIKDRGKAEVGDKTILDSIVPAAEALEKGIKDGDSLGESFRNATLAAEKGFDSTEHMISKHGRGHYYGEKSRGNKDPGAAVGMLIFRALRDCIEK